MKYGENAEHNGARKSGRSIFVPSKVRLEFALVKIGNYSVLKFIVELLKLCTRTLSLGVGWNLAVIKT